MKKINFKNLPSTDIPVSAENLNQMQSNIEESAVIVSPTEPTTSEKVWIQKGKNMVKELFKGSFYSTGNYTLEKHTQFARTGYIKVQPNVDYIFSHSLGNHNGYIACFDENYNFLEVINDQAITTSFKITDTNTKYIIVNMWHDTNIANESNVQLEQGIIATSYEPYIGTKLYAKNDNGIYDEFINVAGANETKYSTTEQRIGTWIDGKPLYRIIIPFNITANSGSLRYSTGGLSIDKVVKISGIGYWNGANGIAIPYYISETDMATFSYGTSSNEVTMKYSFPNATGRSAYCILEYTKTTD